ncbi:MAG: hypothetical protein IJF53_00940, partial [Clostridia bacterium]|nr:hypothetical protein [Clostridia bacterium]
METAVSWNSFYSLRWRFLRFLGSSGLSHKTGVLRGPFYLIDLRQMNGRKSGAASAARAGNPRIFADGREYYSLRWRFLRFLGSSGLSHKTGVLRGPFYLIDLRQMNGRKSSAAS